MKSILPKKFNQFFLLFFLLISAISSSQVTIKKQGFEGTTADNLGYNVSAGAVSVSSTKFMTGAKSLRFANGNTNTTFDNVNLIGYSNVEVSIAFASTGVDNDEDLHIDFSYDGGSNYTDTMQLIDGNSSGTGGQNLDFGTGDAAPGQSSNPFTFTIPTNATSIKIRVRSLALDADEYYYIDDVSIKGTPVAEIDVTGNSVSIADDDITPSTTDDTDFGSADITQGSITKTFIIRNLGAANLTLSNPTLSGSGAAHFVITALPSTLVILPGNSVSFSIKFDPSSIGIKTAIIKITNNDSDENPYNFYIQGRGIDAEIDVRGNATSISNNDSSPSSADDTDFGTFYINSNAVTKTFTIYNTGTTTLTISNPTISGPNAADFIIDTNPNATAIGAGTFKTFVVQFTPTTSGLRKAIITLNNSDFDENPYTFTIQGNVINPKINVTGNGVSIMNYDTTPSTADGTAFGNVLQPLGTSSRSFIIKNVGTTPLLISNPTVSGINASDFIVIANPLTLSIPAGGSTPFTVRFATNVLGQRNAIITIVSNDKNENPFKTFINGYGDKDTDGDGISDYADEDDDNDGITDVIECKTCVTDPFMNGGFENPVIAASSFSIVPTANVTGWQTSAENFIEIWSSGFSSGSGGPVPAAVGNQFAELNANVPGILYQTFCLNGAGGTINWSIKHRGRGGLDQAFVKFGASLANAIASTPIATMVDDNTAWGTYSGIYQIPIGQTQIVLTFQAGYTGSGSQSVGNFIDDVQVVINQKCVDTDGDGIADIADVDDENDGIPDIEEAGFKAYSNNKGTFDMSNSALWKDTNNNGLNDYIEVMIANGTYKILDTDNDLVPNHLDYDSDNDSVFDVDEAGLLNGDGDINGDGVGDGLDTDGDGLLDLFDNYVGFGTVARPYAKDTDGNGVADYLQLKSDGVTFDISKTLYANLDANNDGIIDGSGDSDRDGIKDTFDTNNTIKGSPRDLNRKLYLDFDGRNDYAEDTPILAGLSEATLMAWIDLDGAYSATGYIIGQNKFYLRVHTNKKLQAYVNGIQVQSTIVLTTKRWYHVAAVLGNGTLKIYINGTLAGTTAVTQAIAADVTKLTIGKNPTNNTNYFKGKIDEVRVFNTALTEKQLQRIVHQEIENNSGEIKGTIIPKNIGALPFNSLLRYYRMDTFKDDIIDDLTTPTIDLGTGMKMYNHKVINYQQAPMPFVTLQAGSFATAVNDLSKDIRGLDVIENDATIIDVRHNITETGNNIDTGMIVQSGVLINMTNDTKLQNNWYLKLDGKIDLVDKAQLVQTEDSELAVTSSGLLERDQQGQTNKFNYNYWSSPVSAINTTTINHGFTVADVMKDGTDAPNVQNLLWTSATNSNATNPITLSSYWIFKFQNAGNNYYNWVSVGQNGTLLPGQGYTLKGSNATTGTQNYTFVGKPNNGTITNPVGANNLLLTGNPYPSAIDADKFIADNGASITGTLYFWEHYSTNSSHNTIQYQGGYATYNKTGGTAPVAPSIISGLGSSSKTPKRFIPVGQGFFVTGSAAGGTISFNNAQRMFVRENNSDAFTLFRTTTPTATVDNASTNNAEDTYTTEQFTKIRLGFNSANNYHRQILLGFMNENATAGIDPGYDAINFETLTNDMYFINGTSKLNIQGEGFFNVNNSYKLGVKNAVAGNVTFVIDHLENMDASQQIYIYDGLTSIYHSIKDQSFQVNLAAGVIENRFSLRFKNGDTTLGTTENELVNGLLVTNSQANNTINITNQLMQANAKTVVLYNMIGQQIMVWDVQNRDQSSIVLPTNGMSAGAYIVKVVTDKGTISKKILIK
ncbi:choice-of-anchor D domain-containing protein [Flavobacterium sp.]